MVKIITPGFNLPAISDILFIGWQMILMTTNEKKGQ